MSSNRLYNMFGAKKSLSRDTIEKYGRTDNQRLKNEIEQDSTSDAFEQDALEGWGNLSYDTSVMNRLDSKFNGSTSRTWTWVLGTVVTCLFTFILINSVFTSKTLDHTGFTPELNKTTPVSQIIIEKSDLIVSTEIEKLIARPDQEQIQPEKIKRDNINRYPNLQNELNLEVQPLTGVDIKGQETPPSLILTHQKAKEIYLNDLKIIDYRAYRSKPSIKAKQIILTGTPANNEDKTSNDASYTWKNVDIPYIDYINKSVRIFGKGNYKKALMRFETILKTYPNDVNANFYGGLCLYNLGALQQSVSCFNQCLNGSYSNFDEEALWMKAVSLKATGQKREAEAIFSQIEQSNGFYANQARDERLK